MRPAVRIIAGTLGGRRLKTVEGEGMRPAMGRTREALFSMLASRGIDWQCASALDLFAGSGSLAFEAVSRGARYALLVENANAAARCLHENIRSLGIEAQTRVVKDDALRFLGQSPDRRQAALFDLVFIDPPYGKNLTEPVLRRLVDNNWLAPRSFVTAEVEKDIAFATPDALVPLADRLFGQTRVCVWRMEDRASG
jgi:16S rRNA (guanine966-N2)-methyltransferase